MTMRTLYFSILLFMCGFWFTAPITAQPRSEYPRPQFQRADWQCLNGEWTFCYDLAQNGIGRNFQDSTGFGQRITVPFCVESPLSGIGNKDFVNALWYQRWISIPELWKGKKILLHFGGVDYRTLVFVNGHQAADHFGGCASFTVDITPFAKAGEKANIVLFVRDDVRSRMQPAGKQSTLQNSYSCFYTRVTGIWQTVWMEPVDKSGLRNVRLTPDIDGGRLVVEPSFWSVNGNNKLTVIVKDGQKEVARASQQASAMATLSIKIPNAKLWSPEQPFLYNVQLIVSDNRGHEIDHVSSYAGMRKVELRDKQFYLNNKPYYMRLVLDQGYYPDGIWTAPSDSALRRDVELGKQAGFNGARLHQKVFEQRWLYWADKLGYLAWGESPSWEMDWTSPVAARNMLSEWEEFIDRDYNSPCIVAWSPLNETWQDDNDGQRARLTRDLYYAAHRIDRTRPVVSTSGGYHVGLTDIYAEHNYEHDPVALWQQLKGGEEGHPYVGHADKSYPYQGEPYVLDEFGGFTWKNDDDYAMTWGYGTQADSKEAFYRQLENIVDVVLSMKHICGFCYTQLYDVEQERNGIFTYARDRKFNMNRIYGIFTKSREKAQEHVKELLKQASTTK